MVLNKSTTPGHRLNLSAGSASVIVAISLVGLKLWAFAATGSLSVAASLTDSALDLVISISGLLAIIYAAKPADKEHAFGHSSAEDIAALGQAALLIVSAIVIGIGAVMRLVAPVPHQLTGEGRGIAVMGASVVLTLALVLWQRRVYRRTGSKVVKADSLHYLSDLIPNIGAILALAASSMFALPQIDSVVALAAALILLSGAYRIGRSAFDALMDRSADAKTIEAIEAILDRWPGLFGYHDLKTRTAGAALFIQVHIELDGAQSLEQAHGIGKALKREIRQAFPTADVIIHKDLARK